MKKDIFSNTEILKGIKEGNPTVLRYIYDQYYGAVVDFIVVKHEENPELAEDIFQDALVYIYKRVRKDKLIIQKSSFFTYLMAICKIRLFHHYRLQKKNLIDNYGQLNEYYNDADPDIDIRMRQEIRESLYHSHFNKLSEECVEIIKHSFDGHSANEIAQILGISNGVTTYLSDNNTRNFRDQLHKVQNEYQQDMKKSNKIVAFNKAWHYVASIAAVVVIALSSMYMLDQNKSAEELFQEYYNIDNVYLNTRSGNSTNTDILEQGLILFEKNEYQQSINYFEQLPTSVTALYYSGVAHMEIGEYEIAIFKFDQVISDYLNVFYDQAKWYKGLCLLKQNKTKEAQNIFKNISKSNSYYSQQAKELSSSLK
ncbi:MAG: hypothetical protein B7C24_16875 [Bacteroidetes bacterium 4572_77]|nr:MAG: hypothetical protein B7C24_16875 [Bacteroidetes bacterium 4572_77]